MAKPKPLEGKLSREEIVQQADALLRSLDEAAKAREQEREARQARVAGNRRAFEEQHLARGEERAAQRELGTRLIDVGYRVLAKELHPDKGGSPDAMVRLSEVRKRLLRGEAPWL
jgi:malate synthase